MEELYASDLTFVRINSEAPFINGEMLNQYLEEGMGLLPDTHNCGLRMHQECQGRFLHRRLQRKPLVSDPGIHHGTKMTHLPWCISGSLTPGGGKNVPGITDACAIRNVAYLARDWWPSNYIHEQDRRWNADQPLTTFVPYSSTWLTTSPTNHRPANFWKLFW